MYITTTTDSKYHSHQGIQEPVIVDHGAPPEWLSGTLARHACGVYGETGGFDHNYGGKVQSFSLLVIEASA